MKSFVTARELSGYLDVSRETERRFEIFGELLKKWNSRINLVAKSTLDHMWHRHFADSAQLTQFWKPEYRRWVDIGAGAGFPGLVVAVILAEKAPDCEVTLIESDQRKSVFLQTVVRELGVPAQIISKRIETVSPQNADVVSARALTDLSKLLDYSERHRKKSGICVFLKGRNASAELTSAKESWHMDVSMSPSLTDPEASVIKVGAFERVIPHA